jgi:hypothetical protein
MTATEYNTALKNPTSLLASAGSEVIRSYEDAATAIGRLDAAARLASSGERELLVLRCVATPVGATAKGMIALARADGEGDPSLLAYAKAVRDGAAKARGGVLPTVALLHELLRLPQPQSQPEPRAQQPPTTSTLDELLRDTHERTPPVLKAALAARALRNAPSARPNEPISTAAAARLAGLAVTLVLCVGGAITDAWLTLPPSPDGPLGSPRAARAAEDPAEWLGATFATLAREARAAERGLALTRDLAAADQLRVRDTLGRAAYSALDVLALLRDALVITVPQAARELSLTPPTAGAAVARLVELGIAREITGKARSRAFAYEGLVLALEPGTAGDK